MGCMSSKAFKPYQGKPSKEAFVVERVIGEGGFGKVNAVISKYDNQWYAMKTMTKHRVVEKKEIKVLMNERTILQGLDSPYLVNMHFSFQDDSCCYLVGDVCLGGDMRFNLKHKGPWKENEIKFYIYQVLLGLKYLHDNRIIHRDIKPDNILLDSEGFVKITDVGISCRMDDDGLCNMKSGTVCYMALEQLEKKPHGGKVDIYSTGVTAYEFLTKKRPYKKATDANPSGVTDSLKISDEMKEFLNKCLTGKVEERFDVDEALNHAWFKKDFDIAAIEARTYKVPLVPDITVANCEMGSDAMDMFASEEPKKIDDKDQPLFKDFDWTHPDFKIPDPADYLPGASKYQVANF